MQNLRVAIIIGTPEAIKMAPLINILKKTPDFNTRICVTGQHRDVRSDTRNFSIEPDNDLNIMSTGQDLTDIGTGLLSGLDNF